MEGKRILVVGLARSGIAVARLAERLGARVTATDIRADLDLADFRATFRGDLVLGEHATALVDDADLVVTSPGVPFSNPILARARERGVPVWAEIEFAWRHFAIPTIAVTGTAGKSTTVTLIGEMLRASGLRVYVGGNIGAPLSDAALPLDWLVVEVSSFQLETVDEFCPTIATVLNLSENHLDRHANMDEYAALKARIFANQRIGDAAVLNANDVRVRAMVPPDGVRVYRTVAPENERIVVEGMAFDASARKIPGAHNLGNLQTAGLIAHLAGATVSAIQETIDTFAGLAHRLELVRDWRGVRFYNDSKATTVDSVIRSLESFSAPTFWIAGGRDKGGEWRRVAVHVAARPLKAALLIGEAASLIAAAIAGNAAVTMCGDLASAVAFASRHAVAGDIVLLSPGCASYDQFRDFEDRGNQFKARVEELAA